MTGTGLGGAQPGLPGDNRSHRGNRFVVDQSCIDAGSGPVPRSTARQTVTVRDALTFTQATGGTGTTYRYCPIDQLPGGLRSAVR